MNKILRYSFVALLAMVFENAFADTEVTFTLNDPDAITALGIALPDPGKGTKVEELNKDGVKIVVTSGATESRIFQGSGNNQGKYDFRIYKNGGSLTFTAGSNAVKKIVFTGNNLGNLSGDGYDTDTWTGSASSVTLTATGTATIYTITVTFGEASGKKITTIEFSEGYETKFTPGKDGDKVNLPTAIVKAGDAAVEGATITWSLTKGSNWSADSDPAINGTKIEFGDHSRGDLTVKASYAGNDTYEASAKSYTLQVYKGYMAIKSILEDFPKVGGDTWKAKEAEWKAGIPISYWQVDAKSETEFTSKEALVTFVSGSYTYIKDNDGSLLLYGNDLGFKKGDKISGDLGNNKIGAIYGTLKAYNGLLELAVNKNDVEFVVKSSDNAVEAKTITIDQLDQAYMNEYVKIENAEFVSVDGKNLKFKVGDTELAVYNQFGADAAFEEATKYNLYGMGCIYYKNDAVTPQLYLVEFEKATGGETTVDTWTVAGTKPLVDNSWDPSDTNADMTSTDGVTYTYVKEDITLEAGVSNEFKIVKNHSWDEAYPSSNYSFSVDETAKYKVTITFNATSKEITVDKVKTGEAEDVSHTYSVIGTINGNWDNDTEMTKGDDGLYKAVFENVAKGSYKFKVRVDHDWSVSYPSSDYELTVDNDGSTVTIIFNEGTKEVKATVTTSTGIDAINAAKAENGAVYNLAGQQVEKSYKGLVIKNGKKFFNK